MEIQYKTGNLLEATENIICHSCNIKGGFKSGVAGVIREKWPEAYAAYMHDINKGTLKLGDVQWIKVRKGLMVGNMICQPDYGYDGQRYVSYDAIELAIARINKKWAALPVAFPLIGAGLGGGKWSIIAEIIKSTATDFQPVVYTLDGKIPK